MPILAWVAVGGLGVALLGALGMVGYVVLRGTLELGDTLSARARSGAPRLTLQQRPARAERPAPLHLSFRS